MDMSERDMSCGTSVREACHKAILTRGLLVFLARNDVVTLRSAKLAQLVESGGEFENLGAFSPQLIENSHNIPLASRYSTHERCFTHVPESRTASSLVSGGAMLRPTS